MKAPVVNTLLLMFFVNVLFSQSTLCYGEEAILKFGTTTPYVKVNIGGVEGYFLIDFGTTTSTIDTNNFINGRPMFSQSYKSTFNDFDFMGSWGTVQLNIQNHSDVVGLSGFKQAGIIGTDFLASGIFTLDYENKLFYKAPRTDFYTNDELLNLGFKAVSTKGYYASNNNSLNNSCTTNIPTVPIKIGNVSAMAQIDSGFDDAVFNNSLNINQSFFDALKDGGIQLVANPSSNLVLSTCVKNVTELVNAYTLPKGISFSITSVDGSPIMIDDKVNIFLKHSSLHTARCGGISTWKIPAAQMGASFLKESKKVIFDPFQSKVWFFTQ